jgi:LPS-assembly protein
MKNKILILIFSLLIPHSIYAESLSIQSKEISIDKKTKITVFKKEVVAVDEKKNIFKGEYAEYQKDLKRLKSKGKTIIETSEGYILTGTNVIFDNKNNHIKSDDPAVIRDLENNNIYLKRFEYFTDKNFFKSNGDIKIIDSQENIYNFSQIFIDEKNREILGTDIKSYLNNDSFKYTKENKPRVFANTVKIKDQQTVFTKSIFTLCDYREKDKCPPWSLQANQMTHDKKKKTIYYDNAVIKVYDIPLFYIPKLSHPDPTVDRRSGFLPPTFADSKNLGASFQIPYFWAIDKDKDLTLSNKLFTSQHPLILGEYRQAFRNSNLILDLGYTGGYKEGSKNKKKGDKSHLFSKFVKNFKGTNNSDNNLELTVQHTSHDKYLKLYKIRSQLVSPDVDALQNSLDFTHEDENFFLGFQASAYETLKEGYNDKYEYILPDLVVSRNLFTNNVFGSLDFQSNIKAHNYDTNKFEKFFVNDLDWKFRKFNFKSGFQGSLMGNVKNVNYETKNAPIYKKDPTNELFGALGYLTKIDLFKKTKDSLSHTLTPKVLLRYAPGHMRKEPGRPRLDNNNVFSLNRLPSYNNLESGASSTIGFQYKLNDDDKTKFDFSLAQIISNKENKNMPSSTSLDEKLSDVVGNVNYDFQNKNSSYPIKLSYDFAVDQNYKDLNYNEIKSELNLNPIKFDFGYLQEKKHIGHQEYFKTNLEYTQNDNGLFSFSTKQNLVTNSTEYYNLSYEYLNDCLRAGIVYRREFYNDSELEAEDSLMFKITLTPFGNINSPSFK